MELHVVTPESRPRDGHDLALLVREMERVLRACEAAGPGGSLRGALAHRTFLLLELELERGTPIAFERNEGALASPPLGELPSRYLPRLMRALETHRVERLRFDAGLCFDDFVRLLELLAVKSGDLDDLHPEGFTGRLYESTGAGVIVNEVERTDESPLAPPGPIAPEASPAATPALPGQGALPGGAEWPALEEDPLEAPAMLMKGEQLRLSLRELDRCDDDELYDALIDRLEVATRELWAQGHFEEGYRTLLVLSQHASGSPERATSHSWMAQSALQRFGDEDVIRFVVDRGCACEGGGIRASQILLELGEAPGSVILEALNEECDAARSQRLSGMLLALGEGAVPALSRAISRREGARLQRAVRLAGELQNPKLVAPLANLFDDSGPALRREAAQALAHIGNAEARDVLVRAMGSGREEVAVAAANALGAAGHRDRDGHLAEAFEGALERNEVRLAAALLRTLARDEAPAAFVTRLLGRLFGGPAQGRQPLPLRMAALEALESRRDEQATRLLLAATRDPEARISKRAHAILNERDRVPIT